MFCSSCGRELKDGNKFCTFCGEPVVHNSNPGQSAYAGQNVNEVPNQAETAPNYGTVPDYSATSMPGYGTEPVNAGKGKKGRKKLWIISAAAVVLVALVAILGLTSNAFGNVIRKTFSSPDKYYQYVEELNAKEAVESVATIYDSYFRESLDIEDKSVNGLITLKVEDKGLEELEELADINVEDIAFLKEISLSYNSSIKNRSIGAVLDMNVGKNTVLSGNFIMDMVNEAMYLGVPSFTEKYLGVDFSGMEDMTGASVNAGEVNNIFDKMAEIYEACPDKDKVNKLLFKYFSTVLSAVENVEKENGSVTAEGITQDCVVLTVIIDEATVQAVMKAVLTELKADKDVAEIIEDIALAADQDDVDYILDEWYSFLEDGLDAVGDIEMSETARMEVYVNSKGDIIGRKLEVNEEEEISVVMAEDGSKFGCEYVITSWGDEYFLKGFGKKSGDELTGEFEVGAEMYGDTMSVGFNLEDFDTEALKKGEISGKVIFPLAQAAPLLADAGVPVNMLSSYVLELDMNSTAKEAEVSLGLLADENMLVSLTVSATQDSGSKVVVPSDSSVIMVTEEDDLMVWVESFDMDSFLANLEEAGFPEEIMVPLREELGMAFGV